VIVVIALLLIFLRSCGGDSSEAPHETSQEATEPNEIIVFEDPMMASLIQTAFDKQDIYTEDVAQVTSMTICSDSLILIDGINYDNATDPQLILYGADTYEFDGEKHTEVGTIKTLADLSYFKKLSNLKIYLQPEIDFSTLSDKEKYYNIQFGMNQIESIVFLEGCIGLEWLGLNENNITDLSGIEGLSQLKSVGLNTNQVTDISLLANLSNLKKIDLTYNQVVDMSPVVQLANLETLYLYENNVEDVSPIVGLTNLKDVSLVGNNIHDVSSLKELQSFDRLDLSSNPIENIDEITHIEGLIY
jgi:Leucine-rich repeat (LRR) protein